MTATEWTLQVKRHGWTCCERGWDYAVYCHRSTDKYIRVDGRGVRIA